MIEKVIKFLNDTLESFGIDDHEFDKEATTINLDFAGLTGVNISSNSENDVIFWTNYGNENQFKSDQIQSALSFKPSTKCNEYFNNDEPILSTNDKIELKATLQPLGLESSEDFNDAIELYIKHMTKIQKILNN